MNHLYAVFRTKEGEAVRVRADVPSRIMLMDRRNYHRYTRGLEFEYYGSPRERSRSKIIPPSPGQWYLVVEPSRAGDREARVEIVAA